MPSVRPRWWTELPLIFVVYGAYTAARLLARGDVSTAVDNGLAILRLERSMVLNVEEPLNRLFTEYAAVGVPASFLYASLHYLVTPLILVWLFRRRPLRYRLMRTWLMLSTLLGLVGFTLLPTAPPRLLGQVSGFADSLAQYSGFGWWSDAASAPSGLGDMTNQYAAMPSLHVGWAVWCGVAIWLYGRHRRLAPTVAIGYPLVTAVVVMGTANHYLLDVLGGVLVMAVGYLLAAPALRAADWFRLRTGRPAAILPPPSSLGPELERIPATVRASGTYVAASAAGGVSTGGDIVFAGAGVSSAPGAALPAARGPIDDAQPQQAGAGASLRITGVPAPASWHDPAGFPTTVRGPAGAPGAGADQASSSGNRRASSRDASSGRGPGRSV